jgi:ribonuclease HI
MKFYAVARGKKPGIYTNWEECKASVFGKKRPVFKSFPTQAEAQAFIDQYNTEVEAKRPVSRFSVIQTSTSAFFGGTGTQASTPEALLQFDGGSRGNPGIGGAGAVLSLLKDEPEELAKVAVFLPRATNNQAEYTGLIAGLRKATELGLRKLQIEGDSMLVVEQLKGNWAVNHEGLKPLFAEVKKLLANFDFVAIRHVYRNKNTVADALANKAMDERRSSTT